MGCFARGDVRPQPPERARRALGPDEGRDFPSGDVAGEAQGKVGLAFADLRTAELRQVIESRNK